jgi:hypothetical protein
MRKDNPNSTTQQFFKFRDLMMTNMRIIDGNLRRFEKIITDIINKVKEETEVSELDLEKEEYKDSVFVTADTIVKDGKFYKVKFITEGWTLEDYPKDGKEGKYKFKGNGEVEFEVEASEPEEAYMKLRDHLLNISNIEVVNINEKK